MDRSMLESDPFNVVEGMLIAGYAIGARRGFFYVRAEYPLAIERIENAIGQCRRYGLLGKNILGSGFDFDLEIRLGAGAFVCGEETALIHSIEGERGQPRVRPPYPTESGLWGKPTVINNVETFANVPAIIQFGAEWFRRIGTSQSGGTKVFALAGKVTHTGLVEVPMGTTLQRSGRGNRRRRARAASSSRPSRPAGPPAAASPRKLLDLRIDYDTLAKAGSIMGSGGMIVLDEDDCMVDIAKYFMQVLRGRIVRQMHALPRRHQAHGRDPASGSPPAKATLKDIEKLKRLARLIRKSSLCGLGRARPNPVLSTLEHFQRRIPGPRGRAPLSRPSGAWP